MKKKILVTIPMEEKHKRKIATIASDAEVIYLTPDKAEKSIVQEAEIILGNVAVDAVRGSKNLKWIQLNSAGANQYTEEGVLLEGTILTYARYGIMFTEKNVYLYRKSKRTYVER